MKLACCGIDCAECEAFKATQNDDNDLRAKVAQKWSELYNAPIKTEHINCDGCREDGRKFYYCENMCAVRKCVFERGFENCAPCADYPCSEIEKIFSFAPKLRDRLDGLRA